MEEEVKVDKVIRTKDELKASNEFLGFKITDTETLTVTLTTDVGGWNTVITATLSSPKGLRVFGIPFVTLYKTSVAEANIIRGGDNVGNVEYFVTFWTDWGSSDNDNIKYKIYIGKSGIADPQDIIVKVFWRTLLEEVETSLEED